MTSKAEEVLDPETEEIKTLVNNMIETAKDAGLVGLAANQVGVLQRVFVANVQPEAEQAEFTAFINPKLTINKDQGKVFEWEGCGSIPNRVGLVERWKSITVISEDIQGESFMYATSRPFIARIFQHENDHLNGVLFFSKARQIKVIRK